MSVLFECPCGHVVRFEVEPYPRPMCVGLSFNEESTELQPPIGKRHAWFRMLEQA